MCVRVCVRTRAYVCTRASLAGLSISECEEFTLLPVKWVGSRVTGAGHLGE